MLKKKNINLSVMLVVAGLMILSVFLSACGNNAETAETPIGLRTETTDASLVVGAGNSDLTADETENTIADPAVVVLDSQPEVAPAGSTANDELPLIADRPQHTFDPDTATELSSAEMESLIYMREEEKLARDVYLALYDQWGLNVFQNIAGSEQAHMDSVLTILNSYSVADPAANMGAGEFSNPVFQSLYLQLVEQGGLSPAGALKVGASIEELDIADLEERLAQTSNEYIVQVFSNLLAGSENHLRAFVSNLERQTGEVYQPVYLDLDAYQAIISDTANGGAGNGRQGGNRGGNGNGNGGGNGRGNGQGTGA